MDENVVYVHYGSRKFDRSKWTPISNRMWMTKPLGGLWGSRVGDKHGWANWCRENDFRLDSLKHGKFKFSIAPGANVLELKSREDFVGKPWFQVYTSCFTANFINFVEMAAAGVDAVEVTNIDDLYFDLYGWDCNSIVVLNPEVVRPL